MSNLAAKPTTPKFSALISTPSWQKIINSTLSDPKRAQRFVASITSAVANNPALQECDPSTILSGALLGESLGLSPSPQLGQYYLVPYWNAKKRVKEAQFQLGYRGLIQLALRSGYYKRLNVIAVKAGELVRYDPLWEEVEININTDEIAREASATVGYLAMFEYLNGFRKTIYWSKEKMETHALRYSKGYAAKSGHTFWEKDFDAMAFKTMLRQLISKWGIMSIDLQTAFEEDDIVAESDTDFIQDAATYSDSNAEAPEDSTQESLSEDVTTNVEGQVSLSDV